MEHRPGVVDKWCQEGMVEVNADYYAITRAASVFLGFISRSTGNPFADAVIAGVESTHLGKCKFVVRRIINRFAGIAGGAYHYV